MKGNFGFASQLLDTLKKHNNKAGIMLSSSVQATLAGRFGNSEYGRSKKAGEELFFEYGKETDVYKRQVYSRQLHKQKEYAKIFFSSEDEREQEIYAFTKDMLEKYIESSVVKERIRLTEESKVQLEKIEKDFELGDSEGAAITPYERILAVLGRSDIRSDADVYKRQF